MRNLKTYISLAIVLIPFFALAQEIDNTLSFKNIAANSYFRLNYENDFFSGTDKYYTQGIHLEIVSPAIRKFPLSKTLIHPIEGNTRYGLAVEHDGYTPSNIDKPYILYGDHPFVACLFLKTFAITTDSIHKQRFSAALSTGVVGQAAGGEEMQTGIHRWLNDLTPHGWHNQIHNDAVLNYQVDYEKQLISYRNFFSLDVDAIGDAGTLSDRASLGTTILIGFFSSPFSATANDRKFHAYAYEHAQAAIVGYDASLQGGLFNRSSPYTIGDNDITRLTFQNRFGFVVNYKKLSVEYFQSLSSANFRTGDYHVWGGIQIAWGWK